MSKDNKESNKKNNTNKDAPEDELDKQWEMQDQIHKTCKMKGDSEEKQKKWKEKYG
jgi:TfoX/Sxy family transcriptional regulator of competence genes